MDVITQEINSGDSLSDAEEFKAPIIKVKKKVDQHTDAQNQHTFKKFQQALNYDIVSKPAKIV